MGREPVPNDLFRAARERLPSPSGAPRSMSRQELADAVNAYLYREHKVKDKLNQDHIGKVERGQTRWPGEWRRRGFRAVLGAITDTELGFWFHRTTQEGPAEPAILSHRRAATTSPVAGGHPNREWPNAEAEPVDADLLVADPPDRAAGGLLDRLELRRLQLLKAVTVGTVTRAGIDEWERTVQQHGRATRYRPAPQLLKDLEADLADLQRTLGDHHTSSTLRPLTRLTAQMAGLVFLTLIKLNRPGVAHAWARLARIAADEAGDPATRSWVWAQEAYVCFYDGRLLEAVEVARRAQEFAGRVAAVGVPLAAALEARALAMVGQRRETLAALVRAEAALARLDGDSVTPSAFGYNEAQLRFHEGNALTHLRDTEAAQASQQRALELYPPEDYLDRALVGLDQATCLAHQGNAEAATDSAARVVADLTGEQRAGLVVVRGRELLSILDRQHVTTPDLHELRGLLTQDTKRERKNP